MSKPAEIHISMSDGTVKVVRTTDPQLVCDMLNKSGHVFICFPGDQAIPRNKKG